MEYSQRGAMVYRIPRYSGFTWPILMFPISLERSKTALSFSPASVLRKRLHKTSMRPLLRFESEPESSAIFGYLFVSAALKFESF